MSGKHPSTGYRAIIVDRPLPDAKPEAILRTREPADPPEGFVDTDVLFTSINYKDAIALTGGAGILREYPLTPGIDVVGRVREASHGFREGEIVVVNGAGLGERTDGGLAARAAVPAAATLSLPDGVPARAAAAIGTAGFTAALSVRSLVEHGVTPDSGDIVVTGAAGGVGSFAIALLAARGYRVVAVTGRADSLGDALVALGAAEVVDRSAIGSEVGKPLQASRWAGAIDSVGGPTLVNVLAQTRYDGVVAACGMAGGTDLPGTVMPFILRGVTLAGINSVDAPRERREAAWNDLATLHADAIDRIAPRTEPLDRAAAVAREVLAGKVAGRVVIDVRT
ncbi:acryloyl-CoA reductase [Herbiconiux sp. L3-i23]|uniref:acrylyl-CoA reductase family protein n=1 Tax=Herbiconiux sp. L3-i23 TaxID=2905871 RepID=UPI00205EDA19|nr:acryloyl-CoA reductase [Herbiconiux sp. L3-i23]BDI21298.1 quinone oxidoreductase YhdH/YhfP family protein [Herbiconiux sp. L3-i23]